MLFPEHDPAELHNGHIVECAYDHEAGAWTYMRDRRDKKLPNAYRVFEKVFSSIKVAGAAKRRPSLKCL